MGDKVAEEKEDPAQLMEQTEQIEQKQDSPAANSQNKVYGGIILGVFNFILILALMGGGFYLLQELKDKQQAQSVDINKGDLRGIEVSKQFNEYQSQLGTMQSQIASFSDDIAGKNIHFTKTLADFSQLHIERLETTHKDLNNEIIQLKRQLGKTRGDWLIADAEYLLSVANQRLHLMGDVKTTTMALEAADQRLRESGDTAAFKVREKIAMEIAGLRSVTLPDVVAMYSSLQLLRENVKSLSVIMPYAGKPLTESKQVHDHAEEGSNHGALSSALQLLEGYVTVKHSDQPVTEILTVEEAQFIKQQLNVKLEMIKITLIQQNDVMYKSSIADAKQWLNENFTKNNYSKSFATDLDKLNEIAIRSQFPDISQSLKMLKDITKLRLETDKAGLKSKNELSTEKAIIAPIE